MNWSAMYGFIAVFFFAMTAGTCRIPTPVDPQERDKHFYKIGLFGIVFLVSGALCFLNWGVK